ncbi:MAG: phage major capsid protein [Acidimicrobiales bacterium]
MAYNNIISRTDAAALIPEQTSQQMLTNLSATSAALELSTRIPVSSAQTRLPVLSALPTAYFVTGDTGLKQTTEVNWANKYLNIEELAAIVPIPEAVLDDATFDVWGSIQPLLEGAIARALDAAILFGINKPASWPTDIVATAVTAGNVVARGTATQAQGGIAEDVNKLFSAVESDGFVVNGIAARTSYKGLLRGARGTDGQALADLSGGTLYGEQLQFVAPGLWPTGLSAAEAIAGDWTQSVVGVRQDITYKLLDQAVLTDAAGAIQYNLAQQDMVAMRVVFRVGWQVANVINYEGANNATQFPFAVLRSPAA